MKSLAVFFLFLGACLPLCLGAAAPPVAGPRVVTHENRTLCPETEHGRPANRVNTTSRVEALREELRARDLHAYITLISDDHGTAGSAFDQRVTYISGFSGSNGFTIVTLEHAALWTDGRYFLQAENQMDCFWTLMKISTPGHPTGPDWLVSVLTSGNRVGAYPNYVSIDTWNSYVNKFDRTGIQMISVNDVDLVSKIWDEDTTNTQPPKPQEPLIIHPNEFTGKSSIDKLSDVRKSIADAEADCLVVTILEESAWLFNLRGSDRTDSLFYGYSIIYADNVRPLLFINNVARALGNANLTAHLNINSNGACLTPTQLQNCVELREYNTIVGFLESMPTTIKIWLDPTASYAIYAAANAGDSNRVITPMKYSPIGLMKAIKNEVEREKFNECILRDSAAVVEFMGSFEPQIKNGVRWTETTAAAELQRIRSTYQHYKGVSFETISASGINGAVIHYRPEPGTDALINTTAVYLLDSGGQYWDGTTDVTRTFHFGTPRAIEKEAYTRVLMGAIDLAMTVWPFGYYGSDIDARARVPLWQNGWDYNHGTGHGIGYFLSVHEGPGRINIGYNPAHAPLYEGMFFSDEPGYYEDLSFGIRLETLVSVVKADTPHQFGGKTYLGFKPATLVPFEPNMIDYDLLSKSQKIWLNDYHKRCEEETGRYLLNERNNRTAYDWLVARTQPINVNTATSLTSSTVAISNLLLAIYTLVFIY